MRNKRPVDGTKSNSWLEAEISHRGMSKQEFADAVGVSRSTVYRWLEGDRPKGELIDRIADVLLVDYEVAWSKMGYVDASTFDIDPDSPTARLMPLIERIQWTDERLSKMEMDLRWMIERDRELGAGTNKE